MNRRTLIAVAVIVAAATLFARWMFYAPLTSDEQLALAYPAQPQRIVSMAPSITESLFALGLGDKIVGVTRYCDFPPEAQTKTSVGGFLDPSYEAIVSLKPDLAVLLTIHGEVIGRLNDLGIPTLVVEHRTLDGILESFAILGDACDATGAAQALIAFCEERVAIIREKTRDLDRPSVLLSSARELGTGRLDTVYAAGKNQWYDDLIELAGGVNAYQDSAIQFPALTGEGLLRLDPDVIIEFVPELDGEPYTREDILEEWSAMRGMRAVREGKVYVLSGDHLPIPGPRFVRTLEEMARVLHPGLDWSAP